MLFLIICDAIHIQIRIIKALLKLYSIETVNFNEGAFNFRLDDLSTEFYGHKSKVIYPGFVQLLTTVEYFNIFA